MLIIDDLLLLPINGFRFILGQIQKIADQELNDESVIKEQLLELQLRLEMEEVSEEDFQEQEAELFARLRAIKQRQLEMIGADSHRRIILDCHRSGRRRRRVLGEG